MECNVKEVAVFAAASEAFSEKNINCSIDESLAKFEAVIHKASTANIRVRGYISCVAGCPYQGDVDNHRIKDIASALLSMGCYEVSLGDTIGVATPEVTERLLTELLGTLAPAKLAMHMHDTYGRAIDNIKQSLAMGISTIDSSVAGLGGCPYAEGASGNVATEKVIRLLDELNIAHGVDLQKLSQASQFICEKLGRPAFVD
jgi:hydroxymethylglutaryl-CoA lyase